MHRSSGAKHELMCSCHSCSSVLVRINCRSNRSTRTRRTWHQGPASTHSCSSCHVKLETLKGRLLRNRIAARHLAPTTQRHRLLQHRPGCWLVALQAPALPTRADQAQTNHQDAVLELDARCKHHFRCGARQRSMTTVQFRTELKTSRPSSSIAFARRSLCICAPASSAVFRTQL